MSHFVVPIFDRNLELTRDNFMEFVRATMIGTSYAIDFSFFPSHIELLWLISESALASVNEKFVLS